MKNFLLFILPIIAHCLKPEHILASVLYHHQTGEYHVIYDAYFINSSAFANYTTAYDTDGWDYLTVSSYQGNDNLYTDDQKSYAMGYLEGVLTSDRIWNYYNNMKAYYFNSTNGEMPKHIREFFTKNLNWMRKMSYENKNRDTYWAHVYSVFRQMEGLAYGYNSQVKNFQKISIEEFQMLMASGDIDELQYIKKEDRPDIFKMTTENILLYHERYTHCSALIKAAPDFSNVWFGHNTWRSMSSMIRIFKEYKFKSNKNTEKSMTVAFSGYPGTLTSIDDFFITDQDLYVTETTNVIYNITMFDILTPESLISWVRTMVANRLSEDGKTWTEVFSRYNSGTYNNQFQVLDLKKFDFVNQNIKDNALWILEQVPGYIESADMTSILRYGYWPSYNSPYFTNIRNITGHDLILLNHPELKDFIDYNTCARANIFRRDQGRVSDISRFQKLMRSNQYLTDPLSIGNPRLAIASRGDLDVKTLNCIGAIDAKVASGKDIKGTTNKKLLLISGPTTEGHEPFDHTKTECAKGSQKYQWNGIPKVFDFKWVEYTTKLFGD